MQVITHLLRLADRSPSAIKSMKPEEILNPTVFVAGWEIREPITSATDLLVAIVAGVALWRLLRRGRRTWTLPTRLIIGYFAALMVGMACASVFGHLLQAYMPWEAKAIGWIISAVGLGCFEFGSLYLLRPQLRPSVFRAVGFWILLHHGLFLLAMCFTETRVFSTVKLNSSLSLVFTVLPLQVYRWRQTRADASRWFAMAVLFGIFPALTYNFQLSLDRWFNYHDLSHVLFATYVYLVYQGAKRLLEPVDALQPEPRVREYFL